MITGILVALPDELLTLTKSKLKQGERVTIAKNLLITLSGIGAENASSATQDLIDNGANQLISWGCAGALAPYLKAGDLVIPASITAKDNTQFSTQPDWSKRIINTLEPGIKCYNGSLFESSSVVALASDKAKQYQQTKALAVDMESGALARVAQQANIPFIAIRSIVDPANMDLPQAIIHAMTAKGVISIPTLLRHVCSHPTELPRLINTALHFNSASKTLKTVACQLPQITQNQ